MWRSQRSKFEIHTVLLEYVHSTYLFAFSTNTRKKTFDLEPSMVGHEQDEEKGSDEEPSMVQTHNTYHINPDSKLGNALRVLKKTASAVVDDDPGRSASAAAPQSSLHRTPSGRLSSMYGDDSDVL